MDSFKDKFGLGRKVTGATGGAIGAAIGLIGGPVTSIIGGAFGSVITSVMDDIAARMLSDREKLRVTNAAYYLITGIQEKLNEGLIQRQDGFFEGDDNFTNDGAQLLEGVLLKCKGQYQEKKVQLISNIFKNAAFRLDVSPQMAYQVLTLADNLTYHKICLLSYYGRRNEFLDFIIFNDPFIWYPHVTFSIDTMVSAQDLLEMRNQGIITNNVSADDSSSIVPGTFILTERGQVAFDLLELNQIATNDIIGAIKPFEYQSSWGQSSNRTVNGIHV